jgi:phosphatidylserine decarboxylase
MSSFSTLGRGPIALPGYPLIGATGGVTLASWLLDWPLVALLALAATVFLVNFFRNPTRAIPEDPDAIVAPADGKVILVDEVVESEVLKSPARRLAIFMNVFDVHVNRAPVAGRVVELIHRPGRYLAAQRGEAARVNEQLASLWETEEGHRVLAVQIAGLLARRIIPVVRPGDVLPKGAPFGMICFGSRVDLYLPPECAIMVKPGDRVKAGSSIVARWE